MVYLTCTCSSPKHKEVTCVWSCSSADPNLLGWGAYVVSSLGMKSLDIARRQWPSVVATQGSTKEGQDSGRGRCLLWLPGSATYSLKQICQCASKLIPQGSV